MRRHAPIGDPALRQRVVQAYIEDNLVSLTKPFYREHTQRLQNLAIDLEGTAAQAFLRVRSKTIAGVTPEIQRKVRCS